MSWRECRNQIAVLFRGKSPLFVKIKIGITEEAALIWALMDGEFDGHQGMVRNLIRREAKNIVTKSMDSIYIPVQVLLSISYVIHDKSFKFSHLDFFIIKWI